MYMCIYVYSPYYRFLLVDAIYDSTYIDMHGAGLLINQP